MFKRNFITLRGHFAIPVKTEFSYTLNRAGNVWWYDIIPGTNHCTHHAIARNVLNYGCICWNGENNAHIINTANTEAMRIHMRDYELLLVCDDSRTIIWEIPHIRTLINLPHHAITVKFMLKYLLVRYAFANVCHDVVGIILRSLLECEHAEYVRGREFIKNI